MLLLARSESSRPGDMEMTLNPTPRPNLRAPVSTTIKVLRQIDNPNVYIDDSTCTLNRSRPSPPTSPPINRRKNPEVICLEQENAELKKRVQELEKQSNLRCKIVQEAPKLIGLIDSLSKEQKRSRNIIISLQKRNIELVEELDSYKDQNKQAFREISELTCSVSCLLNGEPMPTNIPEYPSGKGLKEKDIKLVIEQACVGRAIAIEALEKNNGDLVDAIMDLTMLN